MKEVHFERAAISTLPSPIQLSAEYLLAILTKSTHAFQLLDLITNTTFNVSTTLTNELANLVLYNEDMSTTTTLPDTDITQLRWLQRDLCALTNNLNLLVLRRKSLQKTDWVVKFNINKVLIDHYKLQTQNILKFEDLEKLRIHSFAVPNVDIYSDEVFPNYVAIGLENGSISLLEVIEDEVKLILKDIQISSEKKKISVVGLEWSVSIDGVSYLSISLLDNSIYLQKFEFDRRANQLKQVDLKQIRQPSDLKVTITKWEGHFLSIVSTNHLQWHEAGTGVTGDVEIGTIYAITNVCYLPGENTKILVTNTLNYIGVFSKIGEELVKVFDINYNSVKSIETMNDSSLNVLKKKLISLNTKYNNISIRGVVIDPISKNLFIGFASNDPPIEHRRLTQMAFKIQQIPLTYSITFDEVQKINFAKLSPKNVVNFLSQSKVRFSWDDFLNQVKFNKLNIPKDMSFDEVVDLNLSENSQSLSILQIATQLKFHLGLEIKRDIEYEILKFISSIALAYIETNNIELQNKYDLSIYQSYKRIHETNFTLPSTISLTFQNGKFTEIFRFDESDLSTIVSLSNEIPFKRCGVTLLPLTDLNNLKCDSCTNGIINLEVLQKEEIGELTLNILKKFNQKCIYSGDHLYKSY